LACALLTGMTKSHGKKKSLKIVIMKLLKNGIIIVIITSKTDQVWLDIQKGHIRIGRP
jgi:hypothetical protein